MRIIIGKQKKLRQISKTHNSQNVHEIIAFGYCSHTKKLLFTETELSVKIAIFRLKNVNLPKTLVNLN